MNAQRAQKSAAKGGWQKRKAVTGEDVLVPPGKTFDPEQRTFLTTGREVFVAVAPSPRFAVLTSGRQVTL